MRRFVIDPHDHVSARRDARTSGVEVCGFYHSHPTGGPEPSPTDRAEAWYDEMLYLVIGLGSGAAAARLFRPGPEGFVEVEIES